MHLALSVEDSYALECIMSRRRRGTASGCGIIGFLADREDGRDGKGEGQAASVSVDAVTDLCHALFNSSEFVYID